MKNYNKLKQFNLNYLPSQLQEYLKAHWAKKALRVNGHEQFYAETGDPDEKSQLESDNMILFQSDF